MRRRDDFLGAHLPDAGWLARVPTLAGLAAVCAVSLAAVLVRVTWFTLLLAVVMVAVGLSSRIPLRRILAPVARMWIVLAVILLVNAWLSDVTVGAQVVSTLLCCVITAGLFTTTNSIAELLRAFGVLASPLRFVGVDPQRVALAAALTVRTIPVLADMFATTGDAARARGLERSLRARTLPVILRSVKHAQDTGRALSARGIGE